MFKNLARVGTAAAVTATLLGGSLLLAPAANAATHKISSGYVGGTENLKVGSHKDTLTFKATTKKTTLAYHDNVSKTNDYAALTYKITLKSGKHVLYAKTTSTFRALNTQFELLTHKSFPSDKSFVADVKKDVKKSVAASKKSYTALETAFENEFYVAFGSGSIIGAVQEYVKDNPKATDFTNLGFAVTYNKGGAYYTISGTPQAYTIKYGYTANAYVTYDSATKKVAYSPKWIHFTVTVNYLFDLI